MINKYFKYNKLYHRVPYKYKMVIKFNVIFKVKRRKSMATTRFFQNFLNYL